MLQLRPLLQCLCEGGVDFVILGGVAATAHGSARMTLDLDVCYSRTVVSLEKLVAALAPLNPRLRGAPPGLPFKWDARTLRTGLNFTLETDLGPIDLLGEVAGIGPYESALAASELIAFAGMELRVLSLSALIRAKRAAGRKRDLEHLIELEAMQELRAKKKAEL